MKKIRIHTPPPRLKPGKISRGQKGQQKWHSLWPPYLHIDQETCRKLGLGRRAELEQRKKGKRTKRGTSACSHEEPPYGLKCDPMKTVRKQRLNTLWRWNVYNCIRKGHIIFSTCSLLPWFLPPPDESYATDGCFHLTALFSQSLSSSPFPLEGKKSWVSKAGMQTFPWAAPTLWPTTSLSGPLSPTQTHHFLNLSWAFLPPCFLAFLKGKPLFSPLSFFKSSEVGGLKWKTAMRLLSLKNQFRGSLQATNTNHYR